jgi:hypothetical protein
LPDTCFAKKYFLTAQCSAFQEAVYLGFFPGAQDKPLAFQVYEEGSWYLNPRENHPTGGDRPPIVEIQLLSMGKPSLCIS